MEKHYFADMMVRELDAEVVGTGADERGPWAQLNETIFYPEGGGEPGDRGTVGGVRVVDTVKAGGGVRHYLERPVPPGPCRAVLDWPRRWRFMQHHTAQHLLTSLAHKDFGWKTISFHLGEDYATIDLEGSGFLAGRLEALEDAANALLREARPVTTAFMTREEYEKADVRSRLLPEDLEGDIRVVTIEGVDRNTCGGMHVAHLGQIQLIRLEPPEKIKEGIRLPYLAGSGVTGRLRAVEALHERLKGVLGCGVGDFLSTLQAWDRDRQSGKRALRRAQDALLEMIGKGVPDRTFHHFAGADAAFLAKAAHALAARFPERTLVLAADDGEKLAFVVRQGARSSRPAEELFKKVLELTGGKGGGKGAQFQGKAEGTAAIDRLLGRAGELE
jgi:Ser-tRNA(Ala) deacylase AlaX